VGLQQGFEITGQGRSLGVDVAQLDGDPAITRPNAAVPGTTTVWASSAVRILAGRERARRGEPSAGSAAGFDEATRRDPDHHLDWVALVDGNCTQIDAITAEAATRGARVTVLIDWMHVSGYLWDAAKAFFCTDTITGMALARDWVHKRSRMVLQGDAGQVDERIRAQVLGSKLTAAQRKSALKAATYLTNKAPHLDYSTALAKGWPIATGVIKGACRHLPVKDRLEITGARWGLDTAEAILTLRAIVTNGDFDDYWRHHQQQQHHTYPASTTPTTLAA
jgi:hypothetical protein